MNEIYLHNTEFNNAMKTLRSILCLEPSSSINVCLATVSSLITYVKRERKQNKLTTEPEPQPQQ